MSVTQSIHKHLQFWRDMTTHPAAILTMNPVDVTKLAREQIGTKFTTYEELNPVPLEMFTGGHQFGGITLNSDPAQTEGMLSINGNGGFEL